MGRVRTAVELALVLACACGGETQRDPDGTSTGGTGGGTAATGGVVGTGGATVVACPPGLEPCNGTCVDLGVDSASCGACGVRCCPGSVCSAGVCAVACPAGMALCGGGSVEPSCTAACVDLGVDVANCGQCGQACAAGSSCIAGLCDGGQPITEDDLGNCISATDCIVVPYAHCCGATKRAINGAYLDAYDSHPEWHVFTDPGVCAIIGICPDDSAVTSATCVDGRCALVYP
jgi:hypothetical protein